MMKYQCAVPMCSTNGLNQERQEIEKEIIHGGHLIIFLGVRDNLGVTSP
jgi:hypothetical protein